jgi:cellulose synthase (UDP-forming)
MTASPPNSSGATAQPKRLWNRDRPQRFALMLGVILMFSLAISSGWFLRRGEFGTIASRFLTLLGSPPLWLEVPMVAGEYLLAPTVALLVATLIITRRLSPEPRPWSRTVVITMLLILLGRYLTWRIFSSLNLTDGWLSSSLSVGLLLMELFGLSANVIQLVLLLKVRDRRRQADQVGEAVLSGSYQPSVDVFIPTYDEPAFILRRTVIGCQAMSYPRKTIHLLDDTRRPEIQALAQELGCEYRTRPTNEHAKAGNLNYAIARSNAELIVNFDADFIPTTNFLQRTVGFFQDPEIALVQTPQSFYNADPIARNLGLEDILTPEEEVFYRQIQPMRDAAGSVVCAGTSFVVRRSALEATGGFVTESLSEDYFTAINLASQGYKVIYLEEKLSAGLAAESIADQATQRLRWAQGTLQAFFIRTNPLTIKGLTPIQRLGHLEGILHWFTTLARVYFLLMPLTYSFLNVIPLRANAQELMYFFLPYYLIQISVFAWLNHRSRSALLSDVYSLVLVFPLALTVITSLINPFSKGFTVTPKGTASDRFNFNWRLAWPLLILFALTALSLWQNLGQCLGMTEWAAHFKGIGLGWVWSLYNLMMITIALLVMLDVPRPDAHAWFNLRRIVRLDFVDGEGQRQFHWGVTRMISQVGMALELTRGGGSLQGYRGPVGVTLVEAGLELPGQLIALAPPDEPGAAFLQAEVQFETLNLPQERRLVELLFCRPGQWQRRNSPGELRSIWLLFRVLLQPKLLTQNTQVKAVQLSQG